MSFFLPLRESSNLVRGVDHLYYNRDMKAFIFDFDGVIVNSETYWQAIERSEYERLVPELKTYTGNHMGMSANDIYEWLKRDFAPTLDKKLFDDTVEKMAEKVYDNCTLTPGFMQFLEDIQLHTPHIAIGSSSNRAWILKTLTKYNLEKKISTLVTAEDVEIGYGKPHPAIYLRISKQLGIEAKDCIVLEDSKNGVIAGKAAGMYTIGITHLQNKQDVSSADKVVKDFAEIPLAKLFTSDRLGAYEM